MGSRILLAWLFAAAWVAPLAAKTLVLNVATNGNDDWSGDLAVPAPSRDDGPLATLSAALKTVRAARERLPDAFDGVTILLRGGTYYLEEPLLLTPEHSGSSAQDPLLITAYPNERPILSGGRRLTGWKRVEDKPHGGKPRCPKSAPASGISASFSSTASARCGLASPTPATSASKARVPRTSPSGSSSNPATSRRTGPTDGDVEVVALPRLGRSAHAHPGGG